MKLGKILGGKVSGALLSLPMIATGAGAADNWSYAGDNGPANWHNLSPANARCLSGKQQSPINIEGTDPAIMHRLQTGYNVSPLYSSNKRHSITVTYDEGSMLTVGSKWYELQSFTFHSPSEHKINNESFPLAIHFIHRAADGTQAILATMVKEGKENLAARELYENLPLEADQTVKRDKVLINARDFMPTDKSYYRYMGSMTTPPCTEGVNWYILKSPIEFSKEQISLMRGLVGGNNARPLQKRNNRIILDALPQ